MNTSQADTIDLLTNNPVVIGRAVGFKDLTDLHNEWLKDWLYGYGDSTTQAHRGSYKTSDLSVFLALCLLVYRNKNVIFLRKTDSDVAEVIRTVGRVARSGAFQKIGRTLYGITPMVLKETASEIQAALKEKGIELSEEEITSIQDVLMKVKNGEVTKEQIEKWSVQLENGELSEETLELVSGGIEPFSIFLIVSLVVQIAGFGTVCGLALAFSK